MSCVISKYLPPIHNVFSIACNVCGNTNVMFSNVSTNNTVCIHSLGSRGYRGYCQSEYPEFLFT